MNSVGLTFYTPLLNEKDRKQFILVRRIIEISNGKVDEDGALAYLYKHDFNFDACVIDICST